MTTQIAGVHAPDTRLAHDATELAREVSAPYLFHHVTLQGAVFVRARSARPARREIEPIRVAR
ncbi:hypothetical protein [Sorangium sp. So ce1335]|uniref:hypothetical protein n=1 Tax=Sorangium sp. So ce1335 TaxID=3133335 RepID=UPI003F636C02